MCLAIPGKITEIDTSRSLKMGKVDFGGIVKEVCLEYLPDAAVGQYVIVHVGFAISTLDEEEALSTIQLLNEIESGTPDEDENPDPERNSDRL